MKPFLQTIRRQTLKCVFVISYFIIYDTCMTVECMKVQERSKPTLNI